MAALLAENRYGKHRVRLVKVVREAASHTVYEWSVDILIEGDYESCFRSGSNSEVLPTDTMKNTVYSLARRSSATCIEEFAIELVRHFLENYAQAEGVHVEIEEKLWKHLETGGEVQPAAFQQESGERQTCVVIGSRRAGTQMSAGLKGLVILKTAGSSFTGYIKDPLTTLQETSDRLFGTDVSAAWKYDSTRLAFRELRGEVRSALLMAFAAHKSLSVQHTLFAMAEAALGRVSGVSEITLTMPNKHCLLVDLSPFGQDNPQQIFVPTDEPHGYIQARIVRGGSR